MKIDQSTTDAEEFRVGYRRLFKCLNYPLGLRLKGQTTEIQNG